jgi:hypothetical protein
MHMVGFWGLVAALASPVSCAADPQQSAIRYLDLQQPSINQRLESTPESPRAARFVRIEVKEVTNPGGYGLSFEVWFEPARGSRLRLGGFSLFPASNPGKFIVPTQGKVARDGSVTVTLVATDKPAPGVPLKVGIGEISLSNGLD